MQGFVVRLPLSTRYSTWKFPGTMNSFYVLPFWSEAVVCFITFAYLCIFLPVHHFRVGTLVSKASPSISRCYLWQWRHNHHSLISAITNYVRSHRRHISHCEHTIASAHTAYLLHYHLPSRLGSWQRRYR